jgi:Raf kinase inhibitor-like YbhB/YbcL family protein
VAYGIPASITSLPAGVGTSSSKDLIAGKNSAGKATYRGPCPPAGEQPHHYIVGVYALDLAPGAIEPGLTHEALLAAIKGHSLNESSVVLRYAR